MKPWTLSEIEHMWAEEAEPSEADMYDSVEWLVTHVKDLRDLVAAVIEFDELQAPHQELMREVDWKGCTQTSYVS